MPIRPKKEKPIEEETTLQKLPTKKKDIPKKKKSIRVWAHGNKKDQKTGLTIQQEKFIRFYCGIDTVFDRYYKWWSRRSSDEDFDADQLDYEEKEVFVMGNAVKSYMAAYPSSQYNSARANASDLLANANIRKRIAEYLEIAGWSRENVKLQHTSVINQSEELPSKMRAIELYYKITGEMPDEKVKIEHTISDEDRDTIARILSGRRAALASLDTSDN